MNPKAALSFAFAASYPRPLPEFRDLVSEVNQLTGDVKNNLNLGRAMRVIDYINQDPLNVGPCVLFVIQKRLYSSYYEKIMLALTLLDLCIKNTSPLFINLINKDFMNSVYSLLRIEDFSRRTASGTIKHFFSRSSSPVDPRVLHIKKTLLSMFAEWMKIMPMHGALQYTYEKILRKGLSFTGQSDLGDEGVCTSYLSESEYSTLLKIIQDLNASVRIEENIAIYDSLKDRLNTVKKRLFDNLAESKSVRLSSRDSAFFQMKTILDVEKLVNKKRIA